MPVTSAGAPPVLVTCDPPSGSTFPVGSTTVTCTATDAFQRTASCPVVITVIAPPRISVTKFLAFGDSLTNGEVVSADGTFRLRIVDRNKAYPAQLAAMLSERYTAQAITVINDGASGEPAQGAGQSRLRRDLTTHGPDVLLLVQGVIDLSAGGAHAISPTVQALRSMIRDARDRGVRVIVGTLPPERPGGFRAGAAALIAPFNDQLVPMALNEGALVTDLYQGLLPNLNAWIDIDGLHPTVAGYREIAQLFFNTITATFEMAPVPTTTASVPGWRPTLTPQRWRPVRE